MKIAWIALLVMGSAVMASAGPPASDGARPVEQPPPSRPAQPGRNVNAGDPAAQHAPIVIKNVYSPAMGSSSIPQESSTRSSVWEAVTSIATLILVMVTAGLAFFTKKLWQSTHGMLSAAAEQSKALQVSNSEAAKSAVAMASVAQSMATNVSFLRDAVETNKQIAARQKLTTDMQLRAYVFPTGITSYYSPSRDGDLFEWQLKVVWNNFGSTPSKRLSICTTAEIRSTKLSDTFNFPYDEGHIVKGGILVPHTPLNSATVPRGRTITAAEIEEIQAGVKFLYVWGWARYNDAFVDTPQHITRFCWVIEIVGNPRTFVPNATEYTKKLDFRFSMLDFGNCSDEECG